MGIPLLQKISVGSYVVRQRLTGRKRYPLVLMLEPLFRCNLACAGCGKIDYPDEILNQRISVADALEAVDECGAPVVSIAGGEPLLHKELPQIVRRHHRAQEIRLPLHQRAADGKAHEGLRAFALFRLVGASRRQQAGSRQVGVPGRHLRPRRRRDQGGEGQGLPLQHQLHAVQQRRSRAHGALLRRRHGHGRRRHHGVAGLRLRARAGPAALPQPRDAPRTCSATSSSAATAARTGRSASPACSSTSSPATRPITARRGATRRAPCSAGRSPATCSAKATPRPSRS